MPSTMFTQQLAKKRSNNRISINEERIFFTLKRLEPVFGKLIVDSNHSEMNVARSFSLFADKKQLGFTENHTSSGARFLELVVEELIHVIKEEEEKYGVSGNLTLLNEKPGVISEKALELKKNDASVRIRAEVIKWVLDDFYSLHDSLVETFSYYLERKKLFSMFTGVVTILREQGDTKVQPFIMLNIIHKITLEDPDFDNIPLEWQVEVASRLQK